MQSKQSILDEFLEMQAQGKVVYQIDIPSDGGAAMEAFLSPAKRASTVVFEDSDMVEVFKDGTVFDPNMRLEFDSTIVEPRANLLHLDAAVQQHVLSSIHQDASRNFRDLAIKGSETEVADMEDAVTLFADGVFQDLTDRVSRGEYTDTPHRIPPGLCDRIVNLIQARQKALDKKIHWFTFRRDEHNQCFHAWPVASYRYGLTWDRIIDEEGVIPALKRLANRTGIVSIQVSAPVPQHWYFGAIE